MRRSAACRCRVSCVKRHGLRRDRCAPELMAKQTLRSGLVCEAKLIISPAIASGI
jgi:hypothetical protein